MNELLPPWSLLTAFIAASFILAITPGPAVLYIVTRSLAQGRRLGLVSVAGIALGSLGNVIGASIGLAAIFVASSAAFTIVKYAGALYLIYLGIEVLQSPESKASTASLKSARPLKIFRDGFVVALLNPKTAIFFAAFLPQFMGATTKPMLQSVLLGMLFIVIAATTDTVYAITASYLAPVLRRATGFRQFGRYLTGGAFIGLGMMTAFAGGNSE